MTGETVILRVDNARDRMAHAWAIACKLLQFGKSVRVTIEELLPKRSIEQNALFHSLCGELAKQRMWAGKYRDTEAWKRLLVDAWARHEQKSQGEIVPSLDGMSVVNLGIQTRKMRVGDMADLITFAQAYCAEHDVREARDLRKAA